MKTLFAFLLAICPPLRTVLTPTPEDLRNPSSIGDFHDNLDHSPLAN